MFLVFKKKTLRVQLCVLHTDHHSLKWLMSVSDPVGRLARWSLLIQQYDFEIRHRPGAANANADALSRRPYTVPPPSISAYDVPGVQTDRIRELQRRDPDLSDLIQYLETSKLPVQNGAARTVLLIVDDYFLSEDGLLLHIWTPRNRRRATPCQQLVIPTSLRYELLVWTHDDPTGGHFGTVKTYEKLRSRYYWRKMFADVNHWCRSCCDCAMRKSPRNRHKAPLLPVPVEGPFDRVACDVMGPFPVSKSGNRYVVVFSEYLTKWCECFPVPTTEASVIARLLVDEIFCRHGAPRTLLSDRGSNFLSSLVKEVCRLLNTRKVNTTAYHPQTDGLVERFNNTLAEAISSFVSSNQQDWDVYIPAIQFAHRTSLCVSTGDTPFYLLYGREPRLPPDVSLLPPTQLSNSVEEHRARIVSQIAQQLMKQQYDTASADVQFNVGQRVWIYTKKVKRGLSKKLLSKWNGPFRICRKLSPVHFQVRTCDNRLVATTVHANRLKPFYDPADRPILPPQVDDPDNLHFDAADLPPDSFAQSEIDPVTNNNEHTSDTSDTPNDPPVDSPDLCNDPDVYQAEKILQSRKRHGKLQYLVKWTNYPVLESTWEPEENILDRRLLDAFHKKSK